MPRYDPVAIKRLGIAVLAAAMYDAAGVIQTRSAHHGGPRSGAGQVWGRADRVGGRVRGGEVSVEVVMAEAYAWLTTPSERLEFWSECAGLDMDTVIEGADAAIEYAKRTTRRESIFGDVRNPSRMKGRRA